MGARFTLVLIVVLGAAVIIGVIAGRNQSQTAAAPAPTLVPTPAPTPGPHRIDILPDSTGNFSGMYDPTSYTARVGEKITWINLDQKDHTVTADNGAFNSDVLAYRQSFSWTPRKPGIYTYSSFLDPDMRGTLAVRP